MAQEEERKREPSRIRLDATGEGLTRSQLRELEARAAAGDEEAQAELDAALAEIKRAFAAFQPALRTQLDKIAKTIAPLDLSKFYKVSADTGKATTVLRGVGAVKIPPLVQEALSESRRFEIEPLGPRASAGPVEIVEREVQEVAHDVRMARAIEALNERLHALQKRGDRWQAATFVVTLAGVVVAVIVGGSS